MLLFIKPFLLLFTRAHLLLTGFALFLLCWAMPCAAQDYAQLPLLAAEPATLATLLGIDPHALTGTFLGIIIASFIYMLTTSMVIRDRSQIYLVAMMLCMAVYVAADNSYLDLVQKNPLSVLFIKEAALLFFYASSCIFAEQYLEYDISKSLIRYALRMLAGLMVLAFFTAVVDTLFISTIIKWIGFGVLCALMLVGLVSFFRRNTVGSFPFLLAFSSMLLGQIGNLLIEAGTLALPIGGKTLITITFAVTALLFAVVIASQFARRQALKEYELASSNERFQMAARGSDEGLYDWDLVNHEGYFSSRFNRIFGVNFSSYKKQILDLWLKLVHTDDRARVRRAFFGFLRDSGSGSTKLEYRIRRRDGRVAWVTTSMVAERDPTTGMALRLVGSVSDITEMKRAEVRLRASEKRFRGIAEAHPVPVLIVSLADGAILYATQGTENTLHASSDQLLGTGISYFFEDVDQCEGLINDIKAKGLVDLFETTLKRGDHTPFPAAISARSIDYEGKRCAVLGIHDLSERKAAETKIKETEAALQQSEKLAALGGLLAGVAHELNNPLSVIVGQAVLMRESTKDEKTAQRADKIQKAGERCSRIVRSFLALARRKPAERKATSINEVIENSLELLAFQLRTDNIELIRKLDPGLPTAFADGDQITQVITNLIINAKQVLQDREGARKILVETRLAANSSQPAGQAILVAVTDNGPGVPKEIAHRIFEPFFTTKPAGAGTGVGLSLCHSIIESHGGRITVEDAVWENGAGGARFVFTLPASAQEVVQENLGAITAAPLKAVAPQRLLIVDDEVELAQTLADILSPDGHAIKLVHNGRDALDLLAKEEFDIIISDLRMPVLDGPGLYRGIEKNFPRYLTRIIFVTGDTLSTTISAFLSEYALDVIEKPYSPQDVRKAISDLIADNAKNSGAAGKKSGASAPLAQ